MSQTKPLMIAHFLHPQHPLFLEKGGSYICNGCQKPNPNGGLRYCCTACDFDLDVACAMSSKSDDQIMSPTVASLITDNIRHPKHPLTLKSSEDSYRCNGCGKISPNGGVRYHCTACNFDLDWACAISSLPTVDEYNIGETLTSSVPSNDAPSVITNHFRHHNHPLKLRSVYNKAYRCNGCGKIYPDGGARYNCTICDFNLDWSCAEACTKSLSSEQQNSSSIPHVITDHYRHSNHPLTLRKNENGYRCNCCGKIGPGGGTMYHCTTCDYYLDWFCALSTHPINLITPEHGWFCEPSYFPECFDMRKCNCASDQSQKQSQNQNQDWSQNQSNQKQKQKQNQKPNQDNKNQNQNRNITTTTTSTSRSAYKFAKGIAKSVALHYALDIIGNIIN